MQGAMTCSDCIEYKVHSTWTSAEGHKRLQVKEVIAHENTKDHKGMCELVCVCVSVCAYICLCVWHCIYVIVQHTMFIPIKYHYFITNSCMTI